MSPKVIARPYRPDDHAYVTSTFLRSFVESRPRVVGWELPARVIYDGEDAAINNMISSGAAQVDVMATEKDDAAILGYIIRHGNCLDYVYTKKDCRMGGVAKTLIAGLPRLEWYSHITPDGQRLLRHLPGLRFNPYLFWMAS